MKKKLVVEPAVLAQLAKLPQSELEACWLALAPLTGAFGRPHVHAGIGIRKLTKRTYECRGTLAWRFLFEAEEEVLRVRHLVTHGEVRRMLRAGLL